MLKTVRDNVLLPLAGRAGTAVAVWLGGFGVHADLRTQVSIGVTALFLIGFDLASSYVARKYIEHNAQTP